MPWQSLMDDAAPVVNTLKRLGMGNIQLIVLIGALLGMISSLLVFQLGQARIWFAMSEKSAESSEGASLTERISAATR